MSSKTVISLAPTGPKKKNVRAKSVPSDQGGLVVGNANASSSQEAIDRATSHVVYNFIYNFETILV